VDLAPSGWADVEGTLYNIEVLEVIRPFGDLVSNVGNIDAASIETGSVCKALKRSGVLPRHRLPVGSTCLFFSHFQTRNGIQILGAIGVQWACVPVDGIAKTWKIALEPSGWIWGAPVRGVSACAYPVYVDEMAATHPVEMLWAIALYNRTENPVLIPVASEMTVELAISDGRNEERVVFYRPSTDNDALRRKGEVVGIPPGGYLPLSPGAPFWIRSRSKLALKEGAIARVHLRVDDIQRYAYHVRGQDRQVIPEQVWRGAIVSSSWRFTDGGKSYVWAEYIE
jgi:hypothetical protein